MLALSLVPLVPLISVEVSYLRDPVPRIELISMIFRIVALSPPVYLLVVLANVIVILAWVNVSVSKELLLYFVGFPEVVLAFIIYLICLKVSHEFERLGRSGLLWVCFDFFVLYFDVFGFSYFPMENSFLRLNPLSTVF